MPKPVAALRSDEHELFSRCWFCQVQAPDEARSIDTRLQRSRRVRSDDGTADIDSETETVTLHVPRCASCAVAHEALDALGADRSP